MKREKSLDRWLGTTKEKDRRGKGGREEEEGERRKRNDGDGTPESNRSKSSRDGFDSTGEWTLSSAEKEMERSGVA